MADEFVIPLNPAGWGFDKETGTLYVDRFGCRKYMKMGATLGAGIANIAAAGTKTLKFFPGTAAGSYILFPFEVELIAMTAGITATSDGTADFVYQSNDGTGYKTLTTVSIPIGQTDVVARFEPGDILVSQQEKLRIRCTNNGTASIDARALIILQVEPFAL